MCGLGIVVERLPENAGKVNAALEAIAALQAHRGPDGQGTWVGRVRRDNRDVPGPTIGLCHQRLSILDLTMAGFQPFESPCGRYVLIYNGEIYNYRELAAELRHDPRAAGVLAKSMGDTPVIIAAIIVWGAEKALARMNGMWAFALWDREKSVLMLSRDRLGIKPLYLMHTAERLIIASEVKSVLAAGAERRVPNARAVARYLLLGLADYQRDTFFEGVRSFTPGSYVEIDLTGEWPLAIGERPYWQHPFKRGLSTRLVSPEEVRQVFFDAVRVHLRSDVPLGVMLSGGLDSTAVAAAARAVEPDATISTLSVISSDEESNEEPFIDIAVDALGVKSHKYPVDLDHAGIPHAVESLSWHADAPLKSLASVGLARACERAREVGMIVLLSGQGADEQLAGYDKFLYFHLLERLRRLELFSAVGEAVRFALNGTVFPSFTFSEAKRYIPGMLNRAAATTLGAAVVRDSWQSSPTGPSLREREYDDMVRYSVPTLLEDEDRMSMAASTEMRVPFLDVDLVELLAVTPPERKLAKGWTKAIFRDALRPFVPAPICERRDKRGFAVPHRKIMGGPLRSMLEGMFGSQMLSAQARLVDGGAVKRMFNDYIAGSRLVSDREMFRYWALEAWARKFEPFLAV